MKVLITTACVLACMTTVLRAETSELLRNPTFVPLEGQQRPQGWNFGSYRTGAEGLYDAEAGVEGTGAVGVRSRGADQRGSWGQVVPLPDDGHLHVTGWYRTEGIEEPDAALLRVTWRRDDPENLVVSSSHERFEPAGDWTRFELLLPAPAEAVAATIDLFNFFRPGVVWWSDVRARPPGASERESIRNWAAQASLLQGAPVTDGSNLLPNPGFESALQRKGMPDFWQPGGTGGEGYPVSSIAPPPGSVEMRYETARGRSGERSVAVECITPEGRGAWVATVPLAPGPWEMKGWYRTAGMQPEPRQGPVARVSTLDEKGRVILYFYAYGAASEDEWSLLRLPLEAPPGTVAAEVQLRNAWAQGTVLWDDVHLGADLPRQEQAQLDRREDARLLPEARRALQEARQTVDALRERHAEPAGKLLAAALDWALDDAQLAIEADLGREAKGTLDDLADYAARAGDIIAGVKLPPAETRRDGNPYVEQLNAGMEPLARQGAVFRKGEEGYRAVERSWTFRTVGQNAQVLAWGLLNPRSDLRHDPRLLQRLLAHIQALVDHHLGGSVTPHRDSRDWNIDRFALAPALDALMQLEAELPWSILPSKREAWRRGLREMVEYQYRTYGFRYYEHHPPERPRLYPNMDVHYLLIMGIAHRMYDDGRYAVEAQRFVDFMDEGLLPMGAWTYANMQNEVYVYHRLNTQLLARYYQITGSDQARDILDRSRPYYPLVHTPEGMVEHSTDVAWKHIWNAATPAGAEVKAGMFDCADNKRAALDAARRAGHEGGITAVWAAPWWKDIEPAPPKDNWLIFDENVQGPRGQFGSFSFAGTTRVAPGGGIGRDTFVGCMVSDREAARLPLDAALQIATIQYQINPDGPHWRNARYHSGSERHSVLVAPGFAAQAVRYRLTRPGWGAANPEKPWEGVQQWFLSRDRLVGMLTLRPIEDTEAAGVWGRMNFGMDKDFEPDGDSAYRYGSLRVRFHRHNFAGIETREAEDDPGISPRSRELLLKDAESLSGTQPPYSYRAGEERFYTVEVFPATSEPAEQVETIRDGPVLGFAFTDGWKRITVLHNQSDGAVTHRLCVEGPTAEVFAPPGDAEERKVVEGSLEMEIPGGSHRVVASLAVEEVPNGVLDGPFRRPSAVMRPANGCAAGTARAARESAGSKTTLVARAGKPVNMSTASPAPPSPSSTANSAPEIHPE